MNEPNDKPLHDWVRQTLHSYRPSYDAQGWTTVQRALRRRRWWQRGVVGGISLLVFVGIGWLLAPPTESVRQTSAIVSVSNPEHKSIISIPKPIRLAPVSRPLTHRIRQVTRSVPSPQRRIDPGSSLALTSHAQPKLLITNLTETISPTITVAFSPEEAAIRQQMLTGDFGPDSTSYQTLTRNLQQWPDAVVVCDLTSSMYPYSTQLFAWFRQNARNPSIKGIVFFTDCDSSGQQTRPGGPAGQMFVTRERDVAAVLPVMLRAARNTVNNNDDAENTVEALLFAQEKFPQAKHLVLLADNMSQIKDMERLKAVRKPVHVVLCGTTGGNLTQPFQSDYYAVAVQTKGSLHSAEDDVTPNNLSRRTLLHVGEHYYRYHPRKKQFQRTSFDHQPICLFGFIWL